MQVIMEWTPETVKVSLFLATRKQQLGQDRKIMLFLESPKNKKGLLLVGLQYGCTQYLSLLHL